MIKRILLLVSQIIIIVATIIIYKSLTSYNEPSRITEIIEESLMQNRSFLIKRELYLETIIKKEESGYLWGTDKKALIIAKGKVPYGINLEQFSMDQIYVDSVNHQIEIHLNSPEIYDVIISELKFYDVQTGIFINESKYLRSLYDTIFDEAKTTLLKQAEFRLVNEVDRQIKDELVFFISSLFPDSDYTIKIKFTPSLKNTQTKE